MSSKPLLLGSPYYLSREDINLIALYVDELKKLLEKSSKLSGVSDATQAVNQLDQIISKCNPETQLQDDSLRKALSEVFSKTPKGIFNRLNLALVQKVFLIDTGLIKYPFHN